MSHRISPRAPLRPAYVWANAIIALGTVLLVLSSRCSAQAPLKCNPRFQPLQLVDPEECNMAVDLLLPTYSSWIGEEYSTHFGDATLVLRIITSIKNAWFDAIAPYHPTAVGIYSRFPRQPENDRTTLNKNTAIIYSTIPIWLDFFESSEVNATINIILDHMGLPFPDANVHCSNLPTAACTGYEAGIAVRDGRRYDGMNSVGDFDRQIDFNFEPYADTTNYKPKNTAYDLVDPSRWQPNIERKGRGLYKIQQFVTPQMGIVEPYSYDNPNNLPRARPPRASDPHNVDEYKQQVDEVLEASAALTSDQKLRSELFDNKGRSLGSALAAALEVMNNTDIFEYVAFDFGANVAQHDATIWVWNEKRRYDAVRPFSAIRHVYGDDLVEAWGGPGKGTENVSASHWMSYLPPADHPEYPSATTCICHVTAQVARRLTGGSDELGASYATSAGSSRIEKKLPEQFMFINYATWTDFVSDCGESRLWSGVHFREAIDESARLCPSFADTAIDWLEGFIDGTAEVRWPARPLPQPAFYNDENRFSRSRPRGNGNSRRPHDSGNSRQSDGNGNSRRSDGSGNSRQSDGNGNSRRPHDSGNNRQSDGNGNSRRSDGSGNSRRPHDNSNSFQQTTDRSPVLVPPPV